LQRQQEAELYVKGKAIWEIAQILGVSTSTVHSDLKIIQEEWRQSTMLNMDKLKVQQLAKLDRIEREAWEAWTKSREDAESEELATETYYSLKQKKNVTTTSTKKTRAGQAGAAEFLRVIQSCIKQRCEILGLNAPLEVDLKGYAELQNSARDKLLNKLSSIGHAQQPASTKVP
jgi:hypothetical protein